MNNRQFMSWTFAKNQRMYDVLTMHGHKISQMGMFEFQIFETGIITGSITSKLKYYVNKWPHIKWLLTVRNDGYSDVFQAILDNINNAQTTFISEINRILDANPWCSGIDIDLERGGGIENKSKALSLFQAIYNSIHNRQSNNLIHYDLPPMTGVDSSVGGEEWCDYATLSPYFDTCTIMSYGMSWSGSAPGPISPKSWIVDIYNYATDKNNNFANPPIHPSKIFLGLAAYGFRWQIDHVPSGAIGDVYRGGSGLNYYGAIYWLYGLYNHTGDTLPQPRIPFIGYWNWDEMCPHAMLHVYDYLTASDNIDTEYPYVTDTYRDRNFVTSYKKDRTLNANNIIASGVSGDGEIDGAMTNGGSYVSPKIPEEGAELGTATYTFTIPQNGTYEIGVKVNFPWWSKNSIDITIDGVSYSISEDVIWFPYWRTPHWRSMGSFLLDAGEHTLVVSGAIPGVQFYQYCIADSINLIESCGEATFKISPRMYKDVDYNDTQPATAYKITLETLRRDPDSAMIWYEDWRDYGETGLPSYYTINYGAYQVEYDHDDTSTRPYSWLYGNGDISLDYSAFEEVHVRAKFTVNNLSGKAGLYFGNLYACINTATQRVELYDDGILKGSYTTSFSYSSNICIEMRVRGTNCRVYSGSSNTLRFQSTVDVQTGSVGIRTVGTGNISVTLLRIGDAWYYEPYERVQLRNHDGTVDDFGRIERSNVTWNTQFEFFRPKQDVEESTLRTTEISMDYDYLHSRILPSITAGNDYIIKIIGIDMNVWASKIFLGDSDGFSLLYYQDAASFDYFYNISHVDYYTRGVGVWALGQEDMTIWNTIPQLVESVDKYPNGFVRQIVDGNTEENLQYFMYKFDGTDADVTLNGATYNSAPEQQLFRSSVLDLSTGRAFLPNIPVRSGLWGPRTISFWIQTPQENLQNNNTWYIPLTQRTNGNKGYHFGIYNKGLVVRTYDSTQVLRIDTPSEDCILTADTWQHVAFVHTTTEYWLYLDGVLKRHGTFGYMVDYSANTWEIGGMGGTYRFTGKIGGLWLAEANWSDRISQFYSNAWTIPKI